MERGIQMTSKMRNLKCGKRCGMKGYFAEWKNVTWIHWSRFYSTM